MLTMRGHGRSCPVYCDGSGRHRIALRFPEPHHPVSRQVVGHVGRVDPAPRADRTPASRDVGPDVRTVLWSAMPSADRRLAAEAAARRSFAADRRFAVPGKGGAAGTNGTANSCLSRQSWRNLCLVKPSGSTKACMRPIPMAVGTSFALGLRRSLFRIPGDKVTW